MLIAISPFYSPHEMILRDKKGYRLQQRVEERVTFSSWVNPSVDFQTRIGAVLVGFRWSKDFMESVGVLPVCL